MPDRFVIEGNCKRCGGADFTAPDNAIDDSWVTCDSCGQRIMTWKAFKTGALDVAHAEFTKRLEEDHRKT
jgi:DNA-directed RNA polymerase subunit RPC12/RpoP